MKKIISVIFISLLLVSLAAPAALASNLPSWYPEDWSLFHDFHGFHRLFYIMYAEDVGSFHQCDCI